MILIISENDKHDYSRGDTVIAAALFDYYEKRGAHVVFKDRSDFTFEPIKRTFSYPRSMCSYKLGHVDFSKCKWVFFVGPNWIINNEDLNEPKYVYYGYDNFHLNLKFRAKKIGLRSLYYLWQSSLWKKLYLNFKGNIVFVHDYDAHVFSTVNKNVTPLIIPNGLQSEENSFKKKIMFHSSKELITLGFFGSLDSIQSYNALIYIKKICKELKRQNLKIHLKVWGARPSKRFTNLMKTPYIEYLGKFKTLDSLRNEVDLFLFPLYGGTGVKNRVLECISAELPYLANKQSLAQSQISEDLSQLFISSNNIHDWVREIKRYMNEDHCIEYDVKDLTWGKTFSLLERQLICKMNTIGN